MLPPSRPSSPPRSPRGAHPAVVPAVGGRLRLFASIWESFCPDRWVVSVVTKDYHLEFTSPPPTRGGGRVTQTPTDPVLRRVLEGEMQALCEKGAVSRTTGEEGPLFRSSFFLAPKKNGSWRPILNLRPLNVAYIRPRRFRMETLASIIPTLRVGMWAASLDLKDAYLHIPIAPASQRFLAYEYQGETYKFTALPFGLSTSPRVFTRVAGAVVAELRRRGVLLFAYLDDWLVLGDSKAQSWTNVGATITLLMRTGWVINWEKSRPTPAQSLIYLGARLDLAQGRAFPSPERIAALHLALDGLLRAPRSPARVWLRVLGLLASLVDVVPLCRLHMRPLQFHLLSYFRPASRDLDTPVPLSDHVRPHLVWWATDEHLLQGVPFGTFRPSLSVTTDASLSGWGAFCEHRTLAGVWTTEESRLHINVLELEAVGRAVRALQDHVQGSYLTVFSDNTTVVAYINRQGGTRSPQLCLKVWSLLQWCRAHDIVLRAFHVAGKDNTLADALSRGRASQGEWELASRWTTWLFRRFHRPNLDLFATAANAKLPTFCSRAFHPRAWAVDALSMSWDGLDAYAFPPFSLIHKVLLKIRASRTRVLLVAPLWPRQPWFPLLLHLLVDLPVALPPQPDLVSQDGGRVLHPRVQDLHLAAWRLSGIPSEHREFLTTLPPWRPQQGDLPLSALTILDWQNTESGAQSMRLLHVQQL